MSWHQNYEVVPKGRSAHFASGSEEGRTESTPDDGQIRMDALVELHRLANASS